MHKYDTHVHTKESSWQCARLCSREVVRLYKEAGYKGICITDHYRKDYFDARKGSWHEKIQSYLEGYYAALDEGKKIGLEVLLGVEINLTDGTINDYLLMGVTEKFLLENKELYDLSLAQLSELLRNNGIMIFQAHPMREGMKILDFGLLTGIEVLNRKSWHDSSKEAAYAFAREHNMKMLAGSDCHSVSDIGISGILTNETASDSLEFAEILRNNEYSILEP